MTPHDTIDLRSLGLNHTAYLRPTSMRDIAALFSLPNHQNSDQPAYAIHAADGTPLGFAPSLNDGIASLRSHNLTPTMLN